MGNKLAALQQDMINASTEEERAAKEKIFLDEYYRLRTKAENGFFGRMSLKSRLRIHPLILIIYRIKNRLRFMYFYTKGAKVS